jgi:alanyl-tRNA synthetase
MTDRLYYSDPYLHTFDATVRSVERRDDRLIVALDRTAFYPTSGGQPFDTGVLGTLRVVDVVDQEDGSIAHVVERATPNPEPGTLNLEPGRTNPEPGTLNLEPGMRVRGVVDWARRFDHMQQHTGQHVLSAAFDRLFDVRTVSFHLGAAVSTIDLAREVAPADIASAEAEANRIVWEDRPVGIRFVTAEEAARLPLRKEPARGGTLRLIDVEHFDLSACGGTHVARTGGIGIVAVASWERFKGGQRIEFLCGGRALGRWRSLRDTVASTVRQLSVLPEELPAAIERLQADAKEQRRSLVALQTELARFRADELAVSADEVRLKPPLDVAQCGPEALKRPDTTGPFETCRLVARAVDADANGLKALAVAVAARPGHLVVLVSTSTPALVVVARSADVNASAQRLLAALVAKFGGRGGGKAELAQGGGLNASPDTILEAARDAIRST